jgi:hypothetical protein
MPVASCSSLKTLTIQYTTSSIMPDGGYTVQWRVVGDEVWYTEPNKKANPIVIEVVETFGVAGSGLSTCYTYELLDTAQYTYTPCGSTNSVSIYNSSGSQTQQSVCAIDGTVSGGSFTRMGQCLG